MVSSFRERQPLISMSNDSQILKQEAERGPSEALNTANFSQYIPGSVASRIVLRYLGRIEGRGRPLKCFMVLLSDKCKHIIYFNAFITVGELMFVHILFAAVTLLPESELHISEQ